MKTRKRDELLKDSIGLLRQVRLSMHHRSYRSLRKKIDEVILQLEMIVADKEWNPERLQVALKILAHGLATVPTIARIIEMIRSR